MKAPGPEGEGDPFPPEWPIMLWIAGFTLGVIAFGFVLGAPVLPRAIFFCLRRTLAHRRMGGALALP